MERERVYFIYQHYLVRKSYKYFPILFAVFEDFMVSILKWTKFGTIYVSICLCIYVSMYLCVYVFIYISMCLSTL